MSGLLEKLHLKHPAAGAQTGAQTGQTGAINQQPIAGGAPLGTSAYSGLNFPYSNAQAHPQYGYQRLGPQQKAERFELKAAEWERRGNQAKAQKNRQKAQQYRARLAPGYVRPQRTEQYYIQRANLFDQRAQQYQAWGMTPQYQRYQGRAQRIRTKHSINVQPTITQKTVVGAPIVQETVRQDRIVEVQPVVHREVDKNVVHHIEKHYTETAPSLAGTVQVAPVVQQQIHTNVVNEIQPIIHREVAVPVVERTEQHTTQHVVAPTVHTHEVVYETGAFVGTTQTQNVQYTGLNFPYTGAQAHPQFGYNRLDRNKKAERFELKAAEYERRGNLAKAQKNREKAQRIRAKTQPGYVAPVRTPDYYQNRANLYDQRAAQYQQWGMAPQAQRYAGRSQKIKTKHGLFGKSH